MVQLREVSQKEKIIFPIILVFLVGMMLPSAAPLIGMFCFGNLMRESLVVERLSEVVQNSLINIVTIFLGLAVGSKLAADQFLTPETLGNSVSRDNSFFNRNSFRCFNGKTNEYFEFQ